MVLRSAGGTTPTLRKSPNAPSNKGRFIPGQAAESGHPRGSSFSSGFSSGTGGATVEGSARQARTELDRKSTRLNSSHLGISYAVVCLKKTVAGPFLTGCRAGDQGPTLLPPDRFARRGGVQATAGRAPDRPDRLPLVWCFFFLVGRGPQGAFPLLPHALVLRD